MDQGRDWRAHQHIRRHGQLLRGPEGRRHAVQVGQRHAAGNCQESQREQDGLQVYGKYLSFLGSR